MERLIYVSCVVKENKLYDLLRALELHKVGNVEVRPVAPTIFKGEAEPEQIDPGKRFQPGSIRAKVFEMFADGQAWRHSELEQHLKAKKSAVGSALDRMLKDKLIKRVGHGLYQKR